MSLKQKNFVVVLVLILLGLLYFRFAGGQNFNDPAADWPDLKIKIEKKYFGRGQDVTRAAVVLGQAFDEAIQNPEKAKEIQLKLAKADSCFEAVLMRDGMSFSKSIKESGVLEELATSTFERQRRYIRYNANLSGGVYSLVDSDLVNCNFELTGK